MLQMRSWHHHCTVKADAPLLLAENNCNMQAKEALVASYRQLRAGDASGGVVYRITVRQLEALVRLSEAHARIRCSPVIEPRDVREVISQKTTLYHPCL